MNIEQLFAGHPTLAGQGYITITDAARLTTLDETELLREAEIGRLSLFIRLARGQGVDSVSSCRKSPEINRPW